MINLNKWYFGLLIDKQEFYIRFYHLAFHYSYQHGLLIRNSNSKKELGKGANILWCNKKRKKILEEIGNGYFRFH